METPMTHKFQTFEDVPLLALRKSISLNLREGFIYQPDVHEGLVSVKRSGKVADGRIADGRMRLLGP